MMASFQDYQAAFTAHLRTPTHHAPPRGVNRGRMRIYQDIVFNQFMASVSTCFPVLGTILGKRKFRQLVRQCFSQHSFTSPLFQSIPASFVDFLNSTPSSELPPYTAALAHYEWIELALSRESAEPPLPVPTQSAANTSFEPARIHRVSLPAAHRLLHYDFPVHQLSRRQRDLPAADTYLLVYRTQDFQIRFIQLNAITYQLLQQIHLHTATAEQHLKDLTASLPDIPAETLQQFGLQTLLMLASEQAIVFTL